MPSLSVRALKALDNVLCTKPIYFGTTYYGNSITSRGGQLNLIVTPLRNNLI